MIETLPLQVDQLVQFGQLFTGDAVALKDFLLGFFMALAVRRGRVSGLLDKVIPSSSDTDSNDDSSDNESNDSQ